MLLPRRKWGDLKDEKITKAYTSPTPRAKQTAQIILKEHDVLLHEDERFKEVNFGVLEGLPCSFVDTLRLESPYWLDDLKMKLSRWKYRRCYYKTTRSAKRNRKNK